MSELCNNIGFEAFPLAGIASSSGKRHVKAVIKTAYESMGAMSCLAIA